MSWPKYNWQKWSPAGPSVDVLCCTHFLLLATLTYRNCNSQCVSSVILVVVVLAADRLTHWFTLSLSQALTHFWNSKHTVWLSSFFSFLFFRFYSFLKHSFTFYNPLFKWDNHREAETHTSHHNSHHHLSEADYWGIFSNFTWVPLLSLGLGLFQTAISDMKRHTFIRESGCTELGGF